MGFNGHGGRNELLAFEDRSGDGRTSEFTRLDVEPTAGVTCDPSVEGIGPPDRRDPTTKLIPKLESGDASDAEQNACYDACTTAYEPSATQTPFRESRHPRR